MEKSKHNKKVGRKTVKRKIALGKGLDALIPSIESFEASLQGYVECDIDQILPNRYQPRERFSEKELEDLSRSIKQQGIIQPLLVRDTGNGYELIAGERRLRAAKMAGLNEVPVIIKDVSDENLLELSIIENIHRENLTPIEEAEAYHQLISEFDLTQDQVAQRVGKSRSAVANLLRLRHLPVEIKASITDGTLTMGHARALLGTENKAQQTSVWRTVISKKLSVRETEALINRLKTEKKKHPRSSISSDDIYFISLAEDLSRNFGTKVFFQRSRKKGKVVFEYYNNEDLDRLLGLWQKN